MEEYLVAVISLPPGVFNPYSGVKTSILILDKATSEAGRAASASSRSRTTASPLVPRGGPSSRTTFHRRVQKSSEYPVPLERARVLGRLTAYRLGLLVPREKVAASGHYNLSGERYREIVPQTGTFPWKRIRIAGADGQTASEDPEDRIRAALAGFRSSTSRKEPIAGWTDDRRCIGAPVEAACRGFRRPHMRCETHQTSPSLRAPMASRSLKPWMVSNLGTFSTSCA